MRLKFQLVLYYFILDTELNSLITAKINTHIPVLVTVVCASGRYGAELLAIATEGLRGELVLQTQVR